MADCRHCGHPEADHSDRAVVACIMRVENELSVIDRWVICPCPGWAP